VSYQQYHLPTPTVSVRASSSGLPGSPGCEVFVRVLRHALCGGGAMLEVRFWGRPAPPQAPRHSSSAAHASGWGTFVASNDHSACCWHHPRSWHRIEMSRLELMSPCVIRPLVVWLPTGRFIGQSWQSPSNFPKRRLELGNLVPLAPLYFGIVEMSCKEAIFSDPAG
jgi:hypothetical protein